MLLCGKSAVITGSTNGISWLPNWPVIAFATTGRFCWRPAQEFP